MPHVQSFQGVINFYNATCFTSYIITPRTFSDLLLIREVELEYPSGGWIPVITHVQCLHHTG